MPTRFGSTPRSSASQGGAYGGSSLFDLNRQINRLFDDLFVPGATGAGVATISPALDLQRVGDSIEITAELPGVKEDDIDLTVADGVLTLSGEKRSARSDAERGYSERTYGRFERSITLPPNVDEDACSAQFEDGVLTVTLPINEEKTRGKKIPLRQAKSSGGANSEAGQTGKNQSGRPK